MNTRKAFTLVELLTTLVIIALLVGILLPSIAAVRRIARQTVQKAQFASMDMALLAFKQDYGDYPPSSLNSVDYCGAQKLAEALVGWDLMGFHPDSEWTSSGRSVTPPNYYYYDANSTADVGKRRGPYLELATARAFKLGDLFDVSSPLFVLAPGTFVLCDVFQVRKITDAAGKTVTAGAPILYYKANTASKNITALPDLGDRIYNYIHNQPLVDLGKLTATGAVGQPHPLGYDDLVTGFPVFYNDKYSSLPVATYGTNTGYGIRDPKVAYPWPYRPDSYILISAGNDGLYGTADDIHNY